MPCRGGGPPNIPPRPPGPPARARASPAPRRAPRPKAVLEPRQVYRDTGPVAAVIVDCADPRALTPFWAAAGGFAQHGWDGHLSQLRSPGGEGPYLELLHNPREKLVKNRMHLDVAPDLGDDHEAEVARLRQAGATDADVGHGEGSWVVLADPEGNEFCVLSPR